MKASTRATRRLRGAQIQIALAGLVVIGVSRRLPAAPLPPPWPR
jgi:hypothetical protein